MFKLYADRKWGCRPFFLQYLAYMFQKYFFKTRNLLHGHHRENLLKEIHCRTPKLGNLFSGIEPIFLYNISAASGVIFLNLPTLTINF